MNPFEFGLVAAPLAGLLSGIYSAGGHWLIGGAVGLAIGIVCYLMPVLVVSDAYEWWMTDDSLEVSATPPASEYWVALVTLICAMAAPLVAWVVSGLAVRFLLALSTAIMAWIH